MNTARTAFHAALATAGAIAATVVGPAAPALAQVDPCVQRVVVSNNAAFNLSYVLTDRTGVSTTPTDRYPVHQFRSTDLTATSFGAASDVRPLVTPQGGGSPQPGDRFVSFCDNGQTATYIVTGTLNDYRVTLIGS